jgi:hypothetical protein
VINIPVLDIEHLEVGMSGSGSNIKKYMYALAFEAVAGGILTAYATDVLPKIMSGMMRNMMSKMGSEGCSPSEI